jgi:hypothetical protein
VRCRWRGKGTGTLTWYRAFVEPWSAAQRAVVPRALTAPRVRGSGPALLNFKGPTTVCCVRNHCNLTVSSSLPRIDPLSHRRTTTRNRTHRHHEPPATVACEQAQGGRCEDHQSRHLGRGAFARHQVPALVYGDAQGESRLSLEPCRPKEVPRRIHGGVARVQNGGGWIQG